MLRKGGIVHFYIRFSLKKRNIKTISNLFEFSKSFFKISKHKGPFLLVGTNMHVLNHNIGWYRSSFWCVYLCMWVFMYKINFLHSVFPSNFYIFQINTNLVIWLIPFAAIYFCIIPESIFHRQFEHSQEKQFLQCPNSHPVSSLLAYHFKYAVCSLNPSSIWKDTKHNPYKLT